GIRYRRKVTDGQGTVSYSNTVLIFIVNPTTTEGISLNSNKGTDFWLTFGINNVIGNTNYLQLKIAAERATTVTLTFKDNASANSTVTVAAGTLATIQLDATQKAAAYNETNTTGVTTKSLHITSTDSIVVYAINMASATTDATAIYPVGSLGKEYYHMGYIPWTGSTRYDGFAIVAPQNDTHIYQDLLNGTLLATLSAGDVFNYFGPANTDITGTHIVSDKAVAFFSTTTLAWVPPPTGAGDLLYEQLFSVDRWGTHFFAPQTEQTKIRVRVLASQNGTDVTATNASLITDTGGQLTATNISQGQFVEFECVDIAGTYITATHPVMVCTYMVGTNYTGLGGTWGDPALGWIPPIEQKTRATMVSRFTAGTNLAAGNSTHCALIVTATSGKASTMVAVGGGAAAAVSGVTWYDNIDAGLSFCSYPLTTDDYYWFDNPNGLVIGGYGYGSYESYYYLGASAARVLTAPLLINGNYSDEIMGNTYDSCTPITFTCAATTTPTSITWKVNGVVQPSYSNLTTWSATLPVSDYMIEMEAIIGTDTFTQITWFRVRSCP
ncbi:MAG: IgGFc-binding protein, partial [Bacteroidales bacterium]|nr:IgGFc-binding protein [Bacteroidales bacterium]